MHALGRATCVTLAAVCAACAGGPTPSVPRVTVNPNGLAQRLAFMTSGSLEGAAASPTMRDSMRDESVMPMPETLAGRQATEHDHLDYGAAAVPQLGHARISVCTATPTPARKWCEIFH
jgi:hypothetical protein